ncbi:RES family NAD+ phosphorylase [Azoarcus sp. L1K30]|uniref:RES family NAD+ phosphorylase n=1 Tax=Azoarcus sp. L1K30 TaxID=2820277 RepID=UPI001B8294BE|nr:RES family NAD+ phosphorylase [Azoarcus sp. L1K30]
MSFSTWTPRAVSSEARAWRGTAWRIVEAQHVASTMKIVDSRDEQDVLEALLEDGKPALPRQAETLDYLLAAPFRYPTRRGGSRFRAATDPGVFYGAAGVRTACAELGYWRWRFLMDAVDLQRLDPLAHTAFRAQMATSAVDLRAAPFDRDVERWGHPSDYAGTQAFARVARDAGVGAIIYRSVRDPDPAWCVALLSIDGFSRPSPYGASQTWWLMVAPEAVVWRRDQASFTFDTAAWQTGFTSPHVIE